MQDIDVCAQLAWSERQAQDSWYTFNRLRNNANTSLWMYIKGQDLSNVPEKRTNRLVMRLHHCFASNGWMWLCSQWNSTAWGGALFSSSCVYWNMVGVVNCSCRCEWVVCGISYCWRNVGSLVVKAGRHVSHCLLRVAIHSFEVEVAAFLSVCCEIWTGQLDLWVLPNCYYHALMCNIGRQHWLIDPSYMLLDDNIFVWLWNYGTLYPCPTLSRISIVNANTTHWV